MLREGAASASHSASAITLGAKGASTTSGSTAWVGEGKGGGGGDSDTGGKVGKGGNSGADKGAFAVSAGGRGAAVVPRMLNGGVVELSHTVAGAEREALGTASPSSRQHQRSRSMYSPAQAAPPTPTTLQASPTALAIHATASVAARAVGVGRGGGRPFASHGDLPSLQGSPLSHHPSRVRFANTAQEGDGYAASEGGGRHVRSGAASPLPASTPTAGVTPRCSLEAPRPLSRLHPHQQQQQQYAQQLQQQLAALPPIQSGSVAVVILEGPGGPPEQGGNDGSSGYTPNPPPPPQQQQQWRHDVVSPDPLWGGPADTSRDMSCSTGGIMMTRDVSVHSDPGDALALDAVDAEREAALQVQPGVGGGGEGEGGHRHQGSMVVGGAAGPVEAAVCRPPLPHSGALFRARAVSDSGASSIGGRDDAVWGGGASNAGGGGGGVAAAAAAAAARVMMTDAACQPSFSRHDVGACRHPPHPHHDHHYGGAGGSHTLPNPDSFASQGSLARLASAASHHHHRSHSLALRLRAWRLRTLAPVRGWGMRAL